jgi:hypothetical protein
MTRVWQGSAGFGGAIAEVLISCMSLRPLHASDVLLCTAHDCLTGLRLQSAGFVSTRTGKSSTSDYQKLHTENGTSLSVPQKALAQSTNRAY